MNIAHVQITGYRYPLIAFLNIIIIHVFINFNPVTNTLNAAGFAEICPFRRKLGPILQKRHKIIGKCIVSRHFLVADNIIYRQFQNTDISFTDCILHFGNRIKAWKIRGFSFFDCRLCSRLSKFFRNLIIF